MKIRIATFIKHFRFSVHDIRQAIQAYYRIYRLTAEQTRDLNFNFEPVSPVSHSVKFSWFLTEFIVSKVEIEDRNLVLALLREIPGPAGKNIDFRFNFTPECMDSSIHFKKKLNFLNFLPSPSSDFFAAQSRGVISTFSRGGQKIFYFSMPPNY